MLAAPPNPRAAASLPLFLSLLSLIVAYLSHRVLVLPPPLSESNTGNITSLSTLVDAAATLSTSVSSIAQETVISTSPTATPTSSPLEQPTLSSILIRLLSWVVDSLHPDSIPAFGKAIYRLLILRIVFQPIIDFLCRVVDVVSQYLLKKTETQRGRRSELKQIRLPPQYNQ